MISAYEQSRFFGSHTQIPWRLKNRGLAATDLESLRVSRLTEKSELLREYRLEALFNDEWIMLRQSDTPGIVYDAMVATLDYLLFKHQESAPPIEVLEEVRLHDD